MKSSRSDEKRSKAVRRLTRTGTYTFYATIPKKFIEELGWEQGRRLAVRKIGKRIVIEAEKRSR